MKNRLSQIKEKLNDNKLLNINKIWNEELLPDNDLKMLYIHLKMDTKKIAQILHIEAKSVRMSRYRIKQKPGLARKKTCPFFYKT